MSQDYEEFIAALNARGVRYLIVGAHAVAFHARPRATKDLDILLDAARANAKRALDALRDFFGGTDLGYSVDDLVSPDWILQLGVAPVRIDLFTRLAGCPSFKTVWNNKVEGRFGPVKTWYISLEDLIRAKDAAGRPQDRVDARILRDVRRRIP